MHNFSDGVVLIAEADIRRREIISSDGGYCTEQRSSTEKECAV